MRLLAASAALAIAGLAACSSSERPITALEPEPADTVTPTTPDTVVGSLRGYGFTPEQGATNIVVTVNGTTCTDSLATQPSLRLPITAGIMARLDRTRANGGRIYVRPVTHHTFTGRGELRASHEVRLSAGATGLGTANHADQAIDPVQSRSEEVAPELPVAVSQFRAGDTLRLRFDARISARLGGACGQSTVGQVRWRTFGAVLWLAE